MFVPIKLYSAHPHERRLGWFVEISGSQKEVSITELTENFPQNEGLTLETQL